MDLKNLKLEKQSSQNIKMQLQLY